MTHTLSVTGFFMIKNFSFIISFYKYVVHSASQD